MTSNTPSIEISIALVSWINDRLKESIVQREQSRRWRFAEWRQNAGAAIAVGLSGLCVLVLQRWS
jgi:hypothetical protein